MLKVTIKRAGGKTTVTLHGPLDEACDGPLTPLPAKLARTEVTLDCGGIERVNSVGFRHWLRFLKALEATAAFDLARCGGPFLEYTGMLARTAYANRIVSVLVPYRCDACGRTETNVHDLDEAGEGDAGADEFPESICPRCNGLMTSEVEAADYLAFRRTS